MADGQRGEWPLVHLGGAGLWMAGRGHFSGLCWFLSKHSVISGSDVEDFECVEVFPPCQRHTWPVKPCLCHSQGEHHKGVCSGHLGPVAINMCQRVRRVAGEYEKQGTPCLQPEVPQGDFCFGVGITVWAPGWVGRAQCAGRGAETRDLLGSVFGEKGGGDSQPRDGSGTRAAK